LPDVKTLTFQDWRALGQAAEQKRDWVEAERCWRSFVSMEPREWLGHAALARVLREQGRLVDAQQVLDKATHIAPEDSALTLERALLAEYKGDWDCAEHWWRRILAMHPTLLQNHQFWAAAFRRSWESKNPEKPWRSKYEFESFTSAISRPYSSVQLVEMGELVDGDPVSLSTEAQMVEQFVRYVSNPTTRAVSGLISLKNVKIAHGRILICDNNVLYGDHGGPYGVHDHHGVLSIIENYGNVAVEFLQERHVDRPIIQLNLGAYAHYGHWLVEGVPELAFAAMRNYRLKDYDLVFPGRLPTFVQQILKYIGIDENQILTYDGQREAVVAKEALFTLMPHKAQLFAPEFKDVVAWFRERVESMEGPFRESKGGRRIFVRRSERFPNRTLVNQQEIIAAAEGLGLEVVCPEEHPLVEQWRLFADASLIVGEYGSSLHSSIFSAPGVIVCCLTNPSLAESMLLQTGIGQALAQRTEYLYGEACDGQGVLAYRVDEQSFRAVIGRLLAIVSDDR